MTLSSFNSYSLPELSNAEILVAGVDEVGRGALFGPVVAAAVALPLSAFSYLQAIGIKDSKLLSAKRRFHLARQVQRIAKSYQIGYATAEEIDDINIFQASLRAMQRATVALEANPSFCFVDGKYALPDLPMPQLNLVKGDQRSPLVAAASILAKVWRDNLIECLAAKYPQYDLAANKGYGTKRHRLALLQYGPSPQHRLSFRPCRV